MNAIIKYFNSVVAETKAIVWPSRKKVINDTIVVAAALVFGGSFIALVDFGLTELLKYAITNVG